MICGHLKSCDELVNFLPTLHFNFAGSVSGTTFYVPIPPEYYLESVDDDAGCISLLTYDDEEVAGYVLGVPFFRATTLKLDYNATTISVFLDTKEDSPIVPKWPSSVAGVTWDEPLDCNVGLNYTG